MRKNIIIIFLIIGILAFNGCSWNNKRVFETISTGSTQPGDVLIELTLSTVKNGKLEIDIAANTHSVDLSQFDLKEITVLESNGKKFKPVSTPILSGHHSSGTLIFDLGSNIDSYTITIDGIPLVPKRTFAWNE